MEVFRFNDALPVVLRCESEPHCRLSVLLFRLRLVPRVLAAFGVMTVMLELIFFDV